MWARSVGPRPPDLMLLWEGMVICLRWACVLVSLAVYVGSAEPLGWLLSDKGPFHRSQEFIEFTERYQHGFTTRYKIYREFGRWKVNSLAAERQDGNGAALPFDPDFIHNIRLLGRRPSLQKITDTIIKKYGTHFLLSATLGGEESLTIFVDKSKFSRGQQNGGTSNTTASSLTLEALHQLAASYFIDRDSTLWKLHHLQIASTAIKVTETRTGPLGCSNYDNLDSVSSVLVHSQENKVQLQGLQAILPSYLRSNFVQAALGYIGCNAEGQFVCKGNDCWCQCSKEFPQCNCPEADIHSQENYLERMREAWRQENQEFQESDEFQNFMGKLPTQSALNSSRIQQLWRTDSALQQRYRQLESRVSLLLSKTRRTANKLFSLSKRCRTQPKIVSLRERPLSYWLQFTLSILYCSENNQLGFYAEELRTCACLYESSSCQGVVPCKVGDGHRCASCSVDNRTRCSSCNPGYVLSHGVCKYAVPNPTDHYLGFETDLQDLELRYLLQHRDDRITTHAIFVSNDVRLNVWFDPSWRKRMLLTLKSNKFKSNRIHMLLGVSLQICMTKNSTLEPVLSVYVNPFGGSHSESWTMPINQNGYPDWEKTKLDIPLDCFNWTLTLGNRWKSFFETVHFYLRSRIRTESSQGNETVYFEPLEATDASQNFGYMKIHSMQLFGYSMHFDPEAIQDLILQLDYPYTQGSQDSALLQLMEIRYRVNRLSPPGPLPLDLFACLLRHRLKLSSSEVQRILTTLQTFSAKQPFYKEYEAAKLCS
ncbi:BMP/retinoic acid-inducible neural-specific protein 3 isoform X1 [Sinocyclocheilus grahami]|uniref:BMP/retinoic acid-inducible neural-specific protein 3-like n=1 Tax=Sinocyclocheilus grahami TaxID=75366 RepID=A0A672M3Z6_SINGR|nr:PREDICTED: BMP/retinoic acid-inducible neural-specific protein 3-like isoform X1 [Sinocyclocheilus grahami]